MDAHGRLIRREEHIALTHYNRRVILLTLGFSIEAVIFVLEAAIFARLFV